MNWLGEEALGAEWCQELAAVTGEVPAQGVNTQSSVRATGSEQGRCFLLLSSCCLQSNGTLYCL